MRGFAFARRGREGDVVATSACPSSSLSFLTHSTSLKYTVYNCARSRALSVAFTKCSRHESVLLLSCLRSCSPARASPRARTWSPARAPAAARAASTFGASAGQYSSSFSRDAHALRSSSASASDQIISVLTEAHFSRFNALRFRHCSSALSSASRTSGSSDSERVRLHERRIEARRNATRPRRAATGTPRWASTRTREPRRAPGTRWSSDREGESFTTSAGKASCRVFVCVTRICGRFGKGERWSAEAGVRRVRRKKSARFRIGEYLGRGDRAGSGEARRTSLAFIRIRSRRAPHVGQSDASGNASAGRSHTPLSTACVEEKRRTTLEDGSLGSERGERLGETSEGARAYPLPSRIVSGLRRRLPGLSRGFILSHPARAASRSPAVPSLVPNDRQNTHLTKTKFKQFFFGAVAKSIREAASATTSFAHPREL